MSSLSISQILNSRFRTSSEGDKYTIELMKGLGLPTKASVARLAIGRSLALGAFDEPGIDAKGLEIPASSLFTQDDISIWVGLIITHAKSNGLNDVDSMESFRSAVRHHWHRGTKLLMEDWINSDEVFDKFLETLIVRRADLPDDTSRHETSGMVAVSADESDPLLKALEELGIKAEIRGMINGSRLTRYNVFLADVSQLGKLKKSLEQLGLLLNLQQTQPLLSPGTEARVVCLDVPRPKSAWTPINFGVWKEWIKSQASTNDLLVCPGEDISGNMYSFSLAAAPHLLVAGTTGSGKSICLHSIIVSLLLRNKPNDIKLALIDPKQVEFSVYQDSDYLYKGKISDLQSAKSYLSDLVKEMEMRYQQLKSISATNIQEGLSKGLSLPYIVVVIEELADLVMHSKEIEPLIIKLAQKARAAGIHLVLATQRPDAKTFSGLIRSNIPARIALTVQKSTESSIILDDVGAENLLGSGDMLIKVKSNQIDRAHGIFISRNDIEQIVRGR